MSLSDNPRLSEFGYITLRDVFAGVALVGIVAGMNINPLRAHIVTQDADLLGETITLNVARQAYELADAMLAARVPR